MAPNNVTNSRVLVQFFFQSKSYWPWDKYESWLHAYLSHCIYIWTYLGLFSLTNYPRLSFKIAFMTVFISDLFIKRSDISSRSRLNTNTNELNMPTVSPDCNCFDLGKNMFLNRLQMTTLVTFGIVVSENSVMPKIMKDLIIREDRILLSHSPGKIFNSVCIKSVCWKSNTATNTAQQLLVTSILLFLILYQQNTRFWSCSL